MQDLPGDGQAVDVAIVGGGLAGLTAAVYLARAGRQVLLLEKARSLGGRAQTLTREGYFFNLGPHALYQGGEAEEILKEIGVSYTGGSPDVASAWALEQSNLHRLPGGPTSLLTSRLLGISDKLALVKVLARLMSADAQEFQRVSAESWMKQNTGSQRVHDVLKAMMRFSTYVAGAGRLSAAVFIRQMQLSMRAGVCYLDGGWQTLVDGLSEAAERAGVRLRTGARLQTLECGTTRPVLRLADGSRLSASAVLLAIPPDAARDLLPDEDVLQRWVWSAQPVRAATLDVALERLPHPEHQLVIGIDRPLYLSVHSAVADLAPGDGALIHLAKYLRPEDDGAEAETALEGMLDVAQSGWQRHLVTRRFLPEMEVVNQLVAPTEGFDGRPPVQVPGRQHVYLAGDWIGSVGWLADATFASARDAARTLLRESQPMLDLAAARSPTGSPPTLRV